MKTTRIFSVLVIFVSFLMLITPSCKKDNIEPPDPPPVDNTMITLYKNGSVLESTVNFVEANEGDSINVSWKIPPEKISYFEAFWGGESYSTAYEGSKKIKVTDDVTFNFKWTKISDGKTLERGLTVNVIHPNLPPPIFNAWCKGNIMKGQNDTIFWTGEHIASLTLNGMSLPILSGNTVNGYLPIENLAHDTIYHFIYYGIDGTMHKDSVSTTVTLPKTNTEIIGAIAWSPDSLWTKEHFNDSWENKPISPDYKAQWNWFHSNNTAETFQPPNTRICEGSWFFVENETQLQWGSDVFHMTLNPKVLILWHYGVSANLDTLYTMTKYKEHIFR